VSGNVGENWMFGPNQAKCTGRVVPEGSGVLRILPRPAKIFLPWHVSGQKHFLLVTDPAGKNLFAPDFEIQGSEEYDGYEGRTRFVEIMTQQSFKQSIVFYFKIYYFLYSIVPSE
jgi:hypothetical protein